MPVPIYKQPGFRTGAVFDRPNMGDLEDTLHGLSLVGDPDSPARSAVRRKKLVNMAINPVAGVDTSNVIYQGAAGPTVSRLATDGPYPDVQTCFEVNGVMNGANAGVEWGSANVGSRIAVDPNWDGNRQLLVYLACWVKNVSADTGPGWSLTLEWRDTNFAVISSTEVKAADRSTSWQLVEGFHAVSTTARYVVCKCLWWGTNGATVQLRLSGLTCIVDPAFGVPFLPIGSRKNSVWAGAAHASASLGYGNAKPQKPRGFNDNTSTMNNGTAPTFDITNNEALQLSKKCGATVVRFGVDSYTQTRGPDPWPSQTAPIDWRPTYLGQYMDQIRAAGLKAIVIIGGPASWMPPNGTAGTTNAALDPIYDPDLAQFWAKFVEQFGDTLEAVEFTNEPNLHQYWGGSPDPVKYVNRLKTVYDAIKAVRTDVPVISGPLSPAVRTGAAAPNNDMIYTDFLTQAYTAGLKTACDGIGLHPYPAALGSGQGTVDLNFTHGFNRAIREVATIMDANGDTGKLIWVTEVGAATNNTGPLLLPDATERQAARMNALMATMLENHPRVACAIVHSLIHNTTTLRWQAVQAPQLRRRRGYYALQGAWGAPPEHVWTPWRLVGDPGEVAYGANWHQLASNAEPLRFRDDGERVELRGVINRTGAPVAGEAITTLPAGGTDDDLRPSRNVHRQVAAYNTTGATEATGRTTIPAPSGQVQWTAGDPTTLFIIDIEYYLD